VKGYVIDDLYCYSEDLSVCSSEFD